ncbi:hypothetical protein [Tenggerimyces flavus]|uniref:Transmembrane protein n=1 Tax=Tenggerimyces flavus TaxID=1708749 RepID=A0ABV7YKF4_9ACTN|nr:hypothetical protein [Tenggerimyces flavus]MBM7785884.1 hypothetical protein [Tenggerimyces flavus]
MLARILQLDFTLGIARVVAILLALVMIWYFVTSNAIRSDNPFLVPDALLTVLLVVAVVVPRPPLLIFAFAWAAAVWTTSLCTYAVRGEFWQGANHLALITPAVVAAVLLAVARD